MRFSDTHLRRVLERHAARLTALPNVVAVGITGAEDDAAIAVYVRTQEGSESIPATLEDEVEDERVEIPTRVIEIGEIRR